MKKSNEKPTYDNSNDLLVYKKVSHAGVTIIIEIDYVQKRVSFVDYNAKTKQYKHKNWLFAQRGTEHMNGWRNILFAMNEAIDVAQKLLEEREELELKEHAELAKKIFEE